MKKKWLYIPKIKLTYNNCVSWYKWLEPFCQCCSKV